MWCVFVFSKIIFALKSVKYVHIMEFNDGMTTKLNVLYKCSLYIIINNNNNIYLKSTIQCT